MSAFKLLLLLCSVALAAVVPRANYVPDGYCCFTLGDTTTTSKVAQQDENSGLLYFNDNQPNGWYCMKPADPNNILWDAFGNACIIESTGYFQCLDPTPGLTVWTLGQNSSQLLLSHDGSSGYKACPNKSGGEIIESDTANASGCRSIRLVAQGLKGACSSFTS